MLNRLVMVVSLLAATFVFASNATAERRVALVIGNSAYSNAATLRNPRNDASDMADALKRVGFDVVLGIDLDQQRFASTIQQFARMLDEADVALFYYAGHGLQINEKNYLVSINARLNNEFLISSETIELDAIVRLMESKVPMNLVFLDACRNNPLAENLKKNLAAMRRSGELGRGLARIEPTGRDTLIAFAAAPGQEAADGSDRNSPFTAALLKYIPQAGVEISVMLKAVAADVRQATRNAQRPQQLSDMTRTFYFTKAETAIAKVEPSPAPPAKPASPAPAPAPRTAAPGANDHMLEVAYWTAAQNANECEAIRAYLHRFPNGIFVDLAKLSERRLCSAPQQRHVTVLEAAPSAANPPIPAPPAPAPIPPSSKLTPASPPPAASPPQAALPVPQTIPPATKSPPAAPQISQPRPTAPVPAARPAPAFPEAEAPAPSARPSQQQAFAIKPPVPQDQSTAADQPFRDCERCPEMINLPGGSFEMGSREDRTEQPVHKVTVSAFAIGRYPVTIGEWKQCVAAKACSFVPKGDDNLPVFGISWNDTQEYLKWLSRLTGAKYRLPTEAEWEYAARGETSSKYWWGNQVVPGKAACKGCGTDFQMNQPLKVGSFEPNPFGLHDMTGSVSQWIADCWHKDYHDAPADGSSRDVPFCRRHVLRGGSWKNDASYLRTSSRDSYDTGVRYLTHGFRVARSKGN